MGVHGGLQHTQEDERYHTNLYVPGINSDLNSAKSAADQRNHTIIAEVLVVAFEGPTEYRILFFLLSLVIYSVTCIENLLVIFLVWKTPRLHSPMYFLVCNLFFCEFICTTSIAPSMLQNVLLGGVVNSFIGCLIQINIVIAVSIFETFLLMLMSYDRYLAICHPLRYSSLMNNKLCLYLVIVFWLMSFILVAGQFYLLFTITYCAPIKIPFLFCEYTAFMDAACFMTFPTVLADYCWVISYTLYLPFAFIILSYIFIIIAILRIKSSTGRKKAFATCSSHLLVVTLYFVTPIGTILVNTFFEYNIICYMYYLLLPLVNPIIYTLRNQDIHKALKTSVSDMKQYCGIKIHSS